MLDTNVSLTSSLSPARVGQSTTITATVTPQVAGAGTPTGTITFYAGITDLGTVPLDASGQASTTFTASGGGSYSIQAIYSGSSVFAERSSAILTQTEVVPQATSTTLKSTATTASFGTPVTFTATVTPVGGSGTPTGTVTFTDGNTVLGTITLVNGKAALAISTLKRGKHKITAVYSGDVDFLAGAGVSITETIR
jgi:hypothetical protein